MIGITAWISHSGPMTLVSNVARTMSAGIACTFETGEPVILTQHGRSAAVLLDVASYESMMDELALLRDVRQAEDQIAAGQGLSHAAVAKHLRARLGR